MMQTYLEELELSKISQYKALLGLIEPLVESRYIDNVKKLLNKEYKIAVVANMGAGKSTFINAMFGDDILPSYSEATTDAPIYIYSDDDPSNDKAIIVFTDSKMPIELNKKDIKKELKLYAKKDTDQLAQKYKNVYKIHLFWDFYYLQNNKESHLNFVFIDTPGPNNTDDYQVKHHNITKNIILNEADMVLYLFDYGQLDSNLEVANDNIWGYIKQRKAKDKEFEVFFIINKIDMALSDNKRLQEVAQSKSRDMFYANLKEFWLFHEQKAINKLKETAIKYGFSDPTIFTMSAEYQKLARMKNISYDDEDKLDNLKQLFKRVFADRWSEELSRYIQVSWVEEKTRLHIDNIEIQMKDKILKEMKSIFDSLEQYSKSANSKSRTRRYRGNNELCKIYKRKRKWIS